MAPSIDSLPPEIQHMVLKWLSTHDHSLRAFACVSQMCHNLASPFIYHTMKIGVDSENIAFPNLHRWIQSPEGRPTRLQHVRCLAIYQARESFWSGSALSTPDSNNTGTSNRPVLISEQPRALNGCLQLHKELENDAKSSIPSSNDVWLPLADLVLHLPGLLDLCFFVPTEFPECLLDRIHASRPECRLHINLFLRNLATASTDSYAFRLASSPCLFSIKAPHICGHSPDEDESSSYYQDLIALMASGLAPNLKAINFIRHQEYHYFYWQGLGSSIPPPWKGFGENTRTCSEKSRGNLQFLHLDYQHSWITEDTLDHWAARTDFTRLQVLELQTYLPPDALRYLATQFHFPCLTTLTLGKLGEAVEHFGDHAEAVNELLSCLPPLASLTLDGWYPGISIEALAIVHGPSLLELKLLTDPCGDFTIDDLEPLGRHCILLRDLTLSIPRSEGDSDEARFYNVLGSLPNLQFITIDYHVDSIVSSVQNQVDEDGNVWNDAYDHDEFDGKVPDELLEDETEQSVACNGMMRDLLINCAIDAKLARSIFDAISAGNPHISLPLQELNIKFTRAGDIGEECPDHFLSVLYHICHPWRITRHETQRLEHSEEKPRSFQSPPYVLKDYLEAIWRRIWPEKISEDWKSDWRSFPISELT